MRTMWLACGVAVLAGCGGGLERNVPEPAVYVLSAPRVEAGPALPGDLTVLLPAVAPALATERVATRWPGNRMDYYAGANWGGDAAQVVQSALVEVLRSTGRFHSVEAGPGRFHATHLLGVEVSQLEADYRQGAPPVARVVMTATLGRYRERQALASWTVSAEQPATDNTLTAVMAALDAAFGRAALGVVAGTSAAVAGDAAGQP